MTTTALEIQYLTERFGKGKLLRGKREMQMQMNSLGRGRRGKPWLPQSVLGKAQRHHSRHDSLHPPTLPPSLEFVAGVTSQIILKQMLALFTEFELIM